MSQGVSDATAHPIPGVHERGTGRTPTPPPPARGGMPPPPPRPLSPVPPSPYPSAPAGHPPPSPSYFPLCFILFGFLCFINIMMNLFLYSYSLVLFVNMYIIHIQCLYNVYCIYECIIIHVYDVCCKHLDTFFVAVLNLHICWTESTPATNKLGKPLLPPPSRPRHPSVRVLQPERLHPHGGGALNVWRNCTAPPKPKLFFLSCLRHCLDIHPEFANRAPTQSICSTLWLLSLC